MTLWQAAVPPERGVHVLVIGVGRYENDRQDHLSGAVSSAVRAAFWWTNAGDKLLDDRELASIQVLISGPENLMIKMPDGTIGYPSRPTRAAVVAAFDTWLQLTKAKAGDLAVLHWIGHGASPGQSGFSKSHGLYCYDIDPTTGETSAINWLPTLNKIDDQLEGRAMCFIDACRSPYPALRWPQWKGVWEDAFEGGPARAYVYYGASENRPAYTVDADQPGKVDPPENRKLPRGRFANGAVFTEAMLCVLDGLGAIRRNPDIGYAVYEDQIFDILDFKIAQWVRCNQKLGGKEIKPQGAVPAIWHDRALLRAPAPYASIKLSLPNGNTAAHFEFQFEVDTVPQEKPCACDGCWHVDVDYGEREIVARGRHHLIKDDRIFRRSFFADQLSHEITLLGEAP